MIGAYTISLLKVMNVNGKMQKSTLDETKVMSRCVLVGRQFFVQQIAQKVFTKVITTVSLINLNAVYMKVIYLSLMSNLNQIQYI